MPTCLMFFISTFVGTKTEWEFLERKPSNINFKLWKINIIQKTFIHQYLFAKYTYSNG